MKRAPDLPLSPTSVRLINRLGATAQRHGLADEMGNAKDRSDAEFAYNNATNTLRVHIHTMERKLRKLNHEIRTLKADAVSDRRDWSAAKAAISMPTICVEYSNCVVQVKNPFYREVKA